MTKGFAILLAFQAIGELLVLLLRLPISGQICGPICGMAMLLYWLCQSDADTPEYLTSTADGLLANMAVLFVPVGVGMMAHWDLLRADWLAISCALIIGALLTLLTTAWVATHVLHWQAKRQNNADTEAGQLGTTLGQQYQAPLAAGKS
jgi:holin-like protein